MKNESWENLVDKRAWEDGPWKDEPDKKQFHYMGLPCLIVRTEEIGTLCGYVGVDPSHPWYGKNTNQIASQAEAMSLTVHGGINYAKETTDLVGPVLEENDPSDWWWIGFHCANADDYWPGVAKERKTPASWYRDIDYVKTNVESLGLMCRTIGAMSNIQEVRKLDNDIFSLALKLAEGKKELTRSERADCQRLVTAGIVEIERRGSSRRPAVYRLAL